jgi:hypothetical protein
MKRLVQLTAFLATLVLSLAAASAAAKAAALSCGTVITSPGLYALTSDISCVGTGIQVLSSTGVTINLNGHSIIGAGAAGFGIDVESANLVIENGSIRGFGIGVLVYGSAQINNVRIARNFAGIQVSPADIFASSANVHSSFINENAGEGINVGANSFLQLSDSQVSGNGGHGIDASNAAISVAGTVISRNRGNGIYTAGYGAGLTNNQITNNGGDGVFIGENDFPDSYAITDNTAVGNGGHGIVYEADLPGFVIHVIHAEGNIAHDNHTNPQCVNIFCRTS